MNISPCFNPQYPQASAHFFTPGLIRQSAVAIAGIDILSSKSASSLLQRDMMKNQTGAFWLDYLRDYPDNMGCCTAARDNMPFSFALGF
jgi:hypothetical protein